MIDVPIDFLKNIDGYRPKGYSRKQLALLSSKAKFLYIERVTKYNACCDAIGMPEIKMTIKED